MAIITQIQENINTHNKTAKNALHIDTIRAVFRKDIITSHKSKIELLNEFAKANGIKWRKLDRTDIKFKEIAKRYAYTNELNLTNVFKLDGLKIYYANSTNQNRHIAQLEIYGLHQPYKEPPPLMLINELLSIIGNVSSVDLCFDSPKPFNLDELTKHYELSTYERTTHYINSLDLTDLAKICIYDKAFKNSLADKLYRIEATAKIHGYNAKREILPRDERIKAQILQACSDFQEVINLATYEPFYLKRKHLHR